MAKLDKLKQESDAPKIVETNIGAKDGQDKCPKCGSTDISPISDSK